MSCGKNHTYDTYQTAADGVKLAVIEALNIDEETDTLKELWSIYISLRSIADNSAQHSEEITGNIDIDTSIFNVGLTTDIMKGIDLEDLSEGLGAGDSISFE